MVITVVFLRRVPLTLFLTLFSRDLALSTEFLTGFSVPEPEIRSIKKSHSFSSRARFASLSSLRTSSIRYEFLKS